MWEGVKRVAAAALAIRPLKLLAAKRYRVRFWTKWETGYY